jgi:tRNA threonylcarbamoyladenosine biosynthesis protein TsaB
MTLAINGGNKLELSIDSSTKCASIALSQQGNLLWEQTWWSEQNHTTELLPGIESLLERAHRSMSEVDSIAVAKGPGNFSSLRIGISLAKGLAMSLGIPLFGVNTLLIEAFPYLSFNCVVYAALDAGRQELIWAPFSRATDLLQMSSETVSSLDSFLSNVSAPSIICGEGIRARAVDFNGHVEAGVTIMNIAPPTRRAAVLAYLGAQRLEQHASDEANNLEPIYTRGPSITPPKQPKS